MLQNHQDLPRRQCDWLYVSIACEYKTLLHLHSHILTHAHTNTHTHARTYTRTYAHTHASMHIHKNQSLSYCAVVTVVTLYNINMETYSVIVQNTTIIMKCNRHRVFEENTYQQLKISHFTQNYSKSK